MRPVFVSVRALRLATVVMACAVFPAPAAELEPTPANVPASRAAPDRAQANVLLGESHLRKAEFEASEANFRAALAFDPDCARAHLGLGKLDRIHFRRRAARERFARAYSLSPNDPEVIRAYAEVAPDERLELDLLRTFLRVGKKEPREELEAALGHIEMHRRLRGRKIALLDSPYQRYSLPLESWCLRPGAHSGLLLAIQINGGKPVRLVLDTGAQGIFLNPNAAAKLGLERLGSAATRGAGEGGGVAITKTLAESVRIGELEFRNCIVDVAGRPITDGADGVIGSNLLQAFLVRVEGERKMLELVPFPEGAPEADTHAQLWAGEDRRLPQEMRNAIPVYLSGALLLVQAKVNGGKSGYLVLDTGATYTSVSSHLADGVPRAPAPVVGGGGLISRAARAGLVRLTIARQELTDPDAIAFDFDGVSSQEGVEISGLIGFPALRRTALTINYRDGLIELGRPR